MPRTSPYRLILTDAERTELEARARRYTSPYSEVVRAKIVLYAAEGLGNDEIAARLDTPRQVVSKWRKRFHERRRPGNHHLRPVQLRHGPIHQNVSASGGLGCQPDPMTRPSPGRRAVPP